MNIVTIINNKKPDQDKIDRINILHNGIFSNESFH
jgi:hypothetical protein